jgi:xanthine dehydrogenase accessory factor
VSNAELDVRATQLREQGVPFVRARVVSAERPTSAKAGDEAIIHADGSIEGFVGGTCAESTVRAQSLMLLDSRQPLLLRITPTDEPSVGTVDRSPAAGTRTVHNPCLSGGTLEIFLDPVVPPPLVQVHGAGPIAGAVRRLAVELGYRAGDVEPSGSGGATAVVVASHGREEVETLAAALDAGVPYVALVASRKRAAGVLADLAAARPDLAGAPSERIHSPAGLDIGARTASEIALSILAEVVSTRAEASPNAVPEHQEHTAHPESNGEPTKRAALTAVDPVCGMTVAAVETSLHLDHEGRRWYFCGPGCLRAFATHPAGYAES